MGNEKLIPTLPLIVVMRVLACLAFVIQNLFFFFFCSQIYFVYFPV